MLKTIDWPSLPGGLLIQRGLAQLADGELAAEALLVLIVAPRLTALGIAIPMHAKAPADPDLALYHLLAATWGDAAHLQYNALRREVDSCFSTLDRLTHAQTKKHV